ncbi:YybH family protein [Archangium lansingense]|uniref:YybH family protein n=1 Tax=Archangium lansingense TaxID=2995310 RepID=UPI003B7F218A
MTQRGPDPGKSMNAKKLSIPLLTLLCWVAMPPLAGATPAKPTLRQKTQTSPSTQSLLTTTDEQAIRQAVEDYANGFIVEDLQMLLDLWDTTDPDDLSYIATEIDVPMDDLTTLSTYYQSMLSSISIISGNVTNLRIFPKGTDAAYVYCNYTWVYSYKPVNSTSPVLTQPTRATFLLKKRNGQWLYQHFHESIRFHYVPPSP